MNSRKFWLKSMLNIVDPVFFNLSRGELKKNMPIEGNEIRNKSNFKGSYLEALGRSVCGIAPWLNLEPEALQGSEKRLLIKYRAMVSRSIKNALDPKSADFLSFNEEPQNLVDAAFLCQGIMRAEKGIWNNLSQITQKRLIKSIKSTRKIKPNYNNWLLFSAMIEAFLLWLGEEDADTMRIDYALRQLNKWYVGDGWFADGESFHLDYYNSYVIQPMMLDILKVAKTKDGEWQGIYEKLLNRSKRHCVQLERMIAPDGSYPILGRSIAYRYGAFHLLSMMAFEKSLPSDLKEGQVRFALENVIKRLEASASIFDDEGWLKIGLVCGQKGLGEEYITTGSLYLCSLVFLVLGLPPNDSFWQSENIEWSSLKIWGGQDYCLDTAIE